MSKADTQTDLAQFEDADDGAEEKDERPNWNPTADEDPDTGAREACQGCGESVTARFARVFGDNNDEIFACPACSTYREITGNTGRYGAGVGR